jgi:hypothetical protein
VGISPGALGAALLPAGSSGARHSKAESLVKNGPTVMVVKPLPRVLILHTGGTLGEARPPLAGLSSGSAAGSVRGGPAASAGLVVANGGAAAAAPGSTACSPPPA